MKSIPNKGCLTGWLKKVYRYISTIKMPGRNIINIIHTSIHTIIYIISLRIIALSLVLIFSGCGKLWENGEQLLTQNQKQLNMKSFDTVWRTIRDHHYDPKLGGLDWQSVHDELIDKMKNANKMSEARSILHDMISRLHQSHFKIVPKGSYGGMFTSNGFVDMSSAGIGDGITGLDIRINKNQVLVTSVAENSAAWSAGVKPGWVILKINDTATTPLLERITKEFKIKRWQQAMLTINLQSLLTGRVGGTVDMTFLDENIKNVEKTIKLIKPKGKMFSFGNLSDRYIWIETEKIKDTIGYIAFNAFLDIPRIMPAFNKAMTEFMTTDGIIIDLRGNTGGIGSMATGMAGWLFEEKGLSLGTQYTRKGELKYMIRPRPNIYKGPVAVLVDQVSASTSEIFAAGLKDLGRARIFGETTAGAALPSWFKTLPNGDVFQYVVANYKSTGGYYIEGKGVEPDEITPVAREALLNGNDPPMDAAVKWIQKQKFNQENHPVNVSN